jgi:hypothetical protein
MSDRDMELATTEKQALEDASVIDHLVRVFADPAMSPLDESQGNQAQVDDESYRLPPTAVYDQIRKAGVRREDGLRALLLGE